MMANESEELGKAPHPAPGAAPSNEPPTGAVSRRGFLQMVSERARYVAPLVVTLTFATRAAQAASGCVPSGTTVYNQCTTNAECCSNNCVDIDPPNGTLRCQP